MQGNKHMADSTETHIAALEAELADLRAEMQQFTATVSHDLRAPLRHIAAYAQLVQEDAGPQLDAEVQGFLSTITDSARHMGVLLDGLAALSRVGSAPLTPCPVPLRDLVPAVCDEVVAQYPRRHVDWRIAPDLPVVQADPNLLRQVLQQVLDNALKFTAGRECAVIEVQAAPGVDRNHVDLLVRDNGVGYNPALQAQLFRVFGRLHSASQFAGIGMGLVLTRKMLARCGGAVDSEGVVDGGCCVRMSLPLS